MGNVQMINPDRRLRRFRRQLTIRHFQLIRARSDAAGEKNNPCHKLKLPDDPV